MNIIRIFTSLKLVWRLRRWWRRVCWFLFAPVGCYHVTVAATDAFKVKIMAIALGGTDYGPMCPAPAGIDVGTAVTNGFVCLGIALLAFASYFVVHPLAALVLAVSTADTFAQTKRIFRWLKQRLSHPPQRPTST